MNYFKRTVTFLFAVLIVVPCLIKPAPAMDFILGVKGGYFVWDPFLKRIGVTQFEDIDTGNGVLYGPVFSILFTPDLSLSVSGLFGTQSTYWSSQNYYGDDSSGDPRTGTFSVEIGRIDADSALSYRLSENFKIFAGYKYQRTDITLESTTYEISTTSVNSRYEKTDIPMTTSGPALGLGVSAPVGDRYFFAANLSALYMWGNIDFKDKYIEYAGDNPVTPTDDTSFKFTGVNVKVRGINFEPTIGASMGEGMPIFTLGVRGQWTQIKIVDADKIEAKDKWANDYQYGMFVSIVQPF